MGIFHIDSGDGGIAEGKIDLNLNRIRFRACHLSGEPLILTSNECRVIAHSLLSLVQQQVEIRISALEDRNNQQDQYDLEQSEY